ncbi:MAG: hypothetical protein P8173_14385 [Gammaproteobacteria bacterium]
MTQDAAPTAAAGRRLAGWPGWGHQRRENRRILGVGAVFRSIWTTKQQAADGKLSLDLDKKGVYSSCTLKPLIRYIFYGMLVVSGPAGADIDPLVVETEFLNENWFPLPAEQMKNAAVDTALMRISETGQFAFLYAAKGPLAGKAGSLNIVVSLIEPAESAKISIRLSLPNNEVTYVSTSSVSLHNKDYKGIFDALQQLGINGAEQITASLKNTGEETSDTNDQSIRKQIIDLNLHVIKLGGEISKYQQTGHDKEVAEQLSKLDTIINKLDAQNAYAKRSDAVENRKLDAIYAEIKKLNIGSNTDNKPPSSDELSDYDIAQLPKLKKARELKFDKRFNTARAILSKMATDKKLTPAFRAAIVEELNINLPLYEAGIVQNELSGVFMREPVSNEYKDKIAYANKLYDSVLAQKDLALKTRLMVNQKKDQLNLTSESMNTVSMAMYNNSLQNLRVELRQAYARYNMMRSMRMKKGDGPCPDSEMIAKAMKHARVNMPIQNYRPQDDYSCELVLGSPGNKQIVYVFSDEEAEYSER